MQSFRPLLLESDLTPSYSLSDVFSGDAVNGGRRYVMIRPVAVRGN